MNISDLVDGVLLEDDKTEWKRFLNDGSKEADLEKKEKAISWIRTIAAFANGSGGDLYDGVENDGTLSPLSRSMVDEQTKLLQAVCDARLSERIVPKVEPIQVPGTDEFILRFHVYPSARKPVAVKSRGANLIYVRTFGETRSASVDEIASLVLQSENVSFDMAQTDVLYDPADFTKLRSRYLERQKAELTEKILYSAKFLDEGNRLRRGALLFADSCQDEGTRIVAVKWPGLDKGSMVYEAKESFCGDILSGIEFGKNFISSHSKTGAVKTGDGLVPFVSFPSRSVEEGLANAFGHRNYYVQDSQIEINVFLDRLEITSPGSLLGVPRLQKEKDIASILSRRRNPLFAKILEFCDYMDNLGSGFDLISEEYQGYGESHRPYVSSDETSFTLTLPDLTFAKGVLGEGGALPAVSARAPFSGRRDAEILSYCYFDSHSAGEIASYLGISNSTKFRKETLLRLENEGYLHVDRSGRIPLYSSAKNKLFVIG